MNSKLLTIPLLLTTWFCLISAKDVIQPITPAIPQISSLSTKIEDELSMLNNLIEVTKENLEILEKLKIEVADYVKLQEKYAQNTQDEKMTYEMVMSADQILEKIKQQHLTQAFDREFLSELTFFAKLASKWKNDK